MGRKEALAWLARHRNGDGSWGYRPGQSGRAEPTLLAAAAGAGVDLDWVTGAELGFAELLLPAALRQVPDAAALCRRVAKGLLDKHATLVDDTYDVFGHDPTLPGWSWVPNTTPWVEPTSYALLSLKATGLGSHERVLQGEALLRDRQCGDGGWNYGNTQVFEAVLHGFPAPTAWACLALSPGPTVERGLERLRLAPDESSGTSLSLAILARSAWNASLEALPDRLAVRQQGDGGFLDRADITALAALAFQAIDEETHVFDLQA